ncbi:hypothetical protein RB195_007201 [Necator americanus]|uniref:Reverse transcriptase domain-containing protein n=1 Tax=Necator americanus TaxID=51031 RepID=A0ABR1BZ02_NECAM
MKLDTVPGPDFISADVLKAERKGPRAAWTTSRRVDSHKKLLSLVVIFVYYEKAFDSVETNAVLKLVTTHRALERCLLKFNRRTQHLAGLRSSDSRRVSRLVSRREGVTCSLNGWDRYKEQSCGQMNTDIEHREFRRSDGQTSSRSPQKKDMRIFEYLREEIATEPPL